jgi:serine/threonine-protein kinase
MTDVFQVQGSIASQVAGALGVALGSAEAHSLGARPTQDLAAYDAYLKARAITASQPAALRRQAALFEQAVALDSNFVEAWAYLASSLSLLYYNGIPDPAIGARALAAGQRARLLDPDGAWGHLAMARYYFLVALDNAKSAEEYSLALAIRPNDADILRRASGADLAIGRWEEGLGKAIQARRLDPRSVSAARAVQTAQYILHHYPESLEAGTAALTLDPGDFGTIQGQIIPYLMQGDLPGARAVLTAAFPSVSEPDLLAYLGTYQDLFWMLTDEQQKLLVRLMPSSFDDDRGSWAMVLMQTHWLRGDAALSRVYADSARIEMEGQLKAAPGNWQRQVLLGLAMAHLGRKEDAIRLGPAGAAAVPMEKDIGNGPYAQYVLIRIYLLVGENDKALDLLGPLLKVPNAITPQWTRIDPAFKPLQGNARYEKMVAGG